MQFAEAGEQDFSTEIFGVAKVNDRWSRGVYELEDLNGMPIDG